MYDVIRKFTKIVIVILDHIYNTGGHGLYSKLAQQNFLAGIKINAVNRFNPKFAEMFQKA